MRLGVVDYETSMIRSGTKPRTKFAGVALEGGEFEQFNTTAHLLSYLAEKKDCRFYHHTDYEVKQLIVDRYVPENMMIRGSSVIRSNVVGSEWINSYALFPEKLSKILEATGYVKEALQLKDHLEGCECRECDAQLHKRNRGDCVDALAAFIQLGTEYARECGIDPVREGYSTAASAAFAAAERHAGQLPTRLDRRQSYRGGRTEAYRLGFLGDADCWDINSSYPYSFVDLPERDWLLHARVTVKGDEGPSPFFKDNDRSDGLLFPAGTFKTWFYASNYERYIAKHGNIQNVKILERSLVDLTWLKRVAPVLLRIYNKRATGHKAMKFALKIFLNSIYGRIGLKPERTITGRGAKVPEGNSSYFRLGMQDYIWFQKIYSKPRANYPFAAAITCNARARLYDMARRVNTWYVDTDSIYCKKGTQFPVDESQALGGWKRDTDKEGNIKSGPLRIRTVKDYEFAGEVVRKGGGRSTQWTVRLALNRDVVKTIDKTRKTAYSKRRVLPGGRTLPHNL